MSTAVDPKFDGLKVLFILIPGILTFFIVKIFGNPPSPKHPKTDFENALWIFLYGVWSYIVGGFFYGCYCWGIGPQIGKTFWGVILENTNDFVTLAHNVDLQIIPIWISSIVSILFGFIVVGFQRTDILFSLARKFKITNRTSEDDLWGYIHNRPDLDEWVTIRHPTNGKVYVGAVGAYSSPGDEREIILTEVKVYQKSEGSSELIEVDNIPVLYLGLDGKNVVLEFHYKIKTSSHDHVTQS